MAGIEYRVIDRSILLPAYRRWLIDPLLPHLPRSLDPNTITHAGHVANLAGMVLLWMVGQDAPWACAIAALGLQIYLWCDNADGAHARRTGQTSVYGEFLDHGLDQLNTAYIGCLTAMALVVSPAWFVATVLLTSGAAVVTYWEQSVTGVFRLGLLNQVESLMVLTLALLTTATLGPLVWSYEPIAGVTIRGALLAWMTGTILFGAVRALVRVARSAGAAPTGPIAAFIGLSALIVGVTASGQVPWWVGLAAAGALDVFYGMRMLALRFVGRAPTYEPIVIIGGVLVSAILVGQRWGLDRALGPASVLALAIILVGLTVREARRGLAHLRHLAVVMVMTASCVWPTIAWATPCRRLTDVSLEGAELTPIALSQLAARGSITHVQYPRSKDGPLLISATWACPRTPAGALALGVLAPISTPAQAAEWLHLFEPDEVVEDPGPVLEVMRARGARMTPPPAELAKGVVVDRAFARAAVVTMVDGTASVVWRRYRLRDGAASDTVLARLAPPAGAAARLTSSGPLVRVPDSPELAAHAEALREIADATRRARAPRASP